MSDGGGNGGSGLSSSPSHGVEARCRLHMVTSVFPKLIEAQKIWSNPMRCDPVERLPLEMFIAMTDRLDGLSTQALLMTSQRTRTILEPHPMTLVPTPEELWALERMSKGSIFKEALETEEHSEHQEELCCSGCLTTHSRDYFRLEELFKDGAVRKCIGTQFHYEMCAHMSVLSQDLKFIRARHPDPNVLGSPMTCTHSDCADVIPTMQVQGGRIEICYTMDVSPGTHHARPKYLCPHIKIGRISDSAMSALTSTRDESDDDDILQQPGWMTTGPGLGNGRFTCVHDNCPLDIDYYLNQDVSRQTVHLTMYKDLGRQATSLPWMLVVSNPAEPHVTRRTLPRPVRWETGNHPDGLFIEEDASQTEGDQDNSLPSVP